LSTSEYEIKSESSTVSSLSLASLPYLPKSSPLLLPSPPITPLLLLYNELTSICLADRAVAASNCTISRADSSSKRLASNMNGRRSSPDSFALSNTKPCHKFAMLIWLFQISNSTNNFVVFTTTTLLHSHPELYLLAVITSTIVIPYSLPF